MPDEWIVGVVTEFYRREEHIYITDRKYRLYVHFMVRLLLDSCVDPSSETYFTANKRRNEYRKKVRKSRFARIESLVVTFLFFVIYLVRFIKFMRECEKVAGEGKMI